MEDLYYDGVLLNDDSIKELAKNDKIKEDFPYLNNSKIMIPAIIENPKLITMVKQNVLSLINWKILENKELSRDIKVECLYYAIDKIENLPYQLVLSLKDEEIRKMASRGLRAYINLCNVLSSNKVDLLNEIFKKNYESEYTYNPDYPINFALSSPVCFHTSLQRGIYYIDVFNKKAYNDENIDYIIENKLFSNVYSTMYQFPKILIAKIKLDNNFIYRIHSSLLTDVVIEELLKSNFQFDINRFDESKLYSPKLILEFIKRDIGNVKYIHNTSNINDEIINYLIEKKYCFHEGDPIILLENDLIVRSTIILGNIDFILMNNIELSTDSIKFIINYINESSYNIKLINNKSLLNNQQFISFLKTKYQVNNIFDLDEKHMFDNVSRNINKDFLKAFGKDASLVLIDQVVLNNYYIDLENIFKNMNVYKFKVLYDYCKRIENKFSGEFDFFYFIKLTKYFENNLNLLKEFNNYPLNDEIINNLILAINNKDNINSYLDLKMYREVYHKKIISSSLDLKDKMCYLLINGNMADAYSLLNSVINPENAIYLQLYFSPDSVEYNYLELCIELTKTLQFIIDTNDINLLNELFRNVISKYDMNVISNSVSIKNNVLGIYAKVYEKNKINEEDLRKKGKLEECDGVKIYHLEGESFELFSHDLTFNQEDTYTSMTFDSLCHEIDRNNKKYQNYVCTTHESKYANWRLQKNGVALYEFDKNQLLAFGNTDIYICPSKKPLFTSNDSFANPIDMDYIHSGDYTATEFDFLRKNSHNDIYKPKYITCSEECINKYLSLAKEYNIGIVCFNDEKNKEYLSEEYYNYRNNIKKLNCLQIYRLIGMSSNDKKLRMDNECLDDLIIRIKELSLKEQFLLINTLKKYGYQPNLTILTDKQHKK